MKRTAVFPIATLEGTPDHFMQGQIVDLKVGKTLSFDELMAALEAVRIVFVGEVHDNPEHHLIEVQILQGLLAQNNDYLSVAMEFFEVPRQAAIDRYMNGNQTESEFLEAVKWQSSWSFPYRFYRPLILLAKENRCPILAMNAPHAVVRKVARSGLKSLTPEERARIADQIDLKNDAHRDYLRQVYRSHPHHKMKQFDTFYQAQCVWEETMADEIARYLKKTKAKMVMFTGNGHLLNHFGIPDRVLRRIPVGMATVMLYPLTDAITVNKKMADYIWLTSGCSAGMPVMHHRRSDRPEQ
jgi:uncharacterized iron-regulated protein